MFGAQHPNGWAMLREKVNNNEKNRSPCQGFSYSKKYTAFIFLKYDNRRMLNAIIQLPNSTFSILVRWFTVKSKQKHSTDVHCLVVDFCVNRYFISFVCR